MEWIKPTYDKDAFVMVMLEEMKWNGPSLDVIDPEDYKNYKNDGTKNLDPGMVFSYKCKPGTLVKNKLRKAAKVYDKSIKLTFFDVLNFGVKHEYVFGVIVKN